MQKWEYMVIEIQYGIRPIFIIYQSNNETIEKQRISRSSIISLINEYGKNGWEVINLTKDLTGRNYISLLLKRPIEGK